MADTDPGPTAPDQVSPIKISSQNPIDYACRLCDATLPDGALVHAAYNDANELVGVMADTDPDNSASDTVLHRCGTLAVAP